MSEPSEPSDPTPSESTPDPWAPPGAGGATASGSASGPAFGEAFGDPTYVPPPYPYAAPVGYGYAYGPPPPPPPSGTNGFAVAGFVLSLLCVIPLAVVFSIIGLVKVGASRQKGKGLAVAGLVVSAAWLVVGVLVVAATLARPPVRDAAGSVVTTTKVGVDQLRVGDCILVPSDVNATVFDATVVPCARLHDGEVYARLTLTLTGSYPGDAAVEAAADQQCQAAFEPYVGTVYDDSSLDFTFLYPQKKEWNLGDRGITCVVTPGKGQTTGTAKGSGR